MAELLPKDEGPDTKLARKYGLNDDQIEALGGMGSIIPRASIWRFQKKSAEQIRGSIERYSDSYLAATQLFVDALNEGGPSLECANKQLIKLTRLAIKRDIEIRAELIIRSLTLPPEHPDSST
ncbi:hypothetical protein KKA95_04940 [Patescibacteria group bacterium]|nr:hypothetical protein [Patescibacteria group bacterium]